MSRESVLFVCTHNSARSQMAEALLRVRGGHRYEVFSAGTQPSWVHPMAVRAMKEIGVDISAHRSEHVDRFRSRRLDFVVTVCNSAREACPHVPATRQNIHQAFTDPASVGNSPEDQLNAFRRVRDEISGWIAQTFAVL